MFVKPIDPKVGRKGGRRYRSLFCIISTLSVRNPVIWSKELCMLSFCGIKQKPRHAAGIEYNLVHYI